MSNVVEDRIAARVVPIVARGAGLRESDVHLDMTLRDLGCDSLDKVELVMALEDEFGIEIIDEDAAGMATVQQMVDCVRRLVS